MADKDATFKVNSSASRAGSNGDPGEEALPLSFERDLQAARDFYLKLASCGGGAVLALEPEGLLFADELARVSSRVGRARRTGAGRWRLPGEGGYMLAVAPMGALEAVDSHGERRRLLGEVFNLIEPGGVFALDFQMPPATDGTDGVSRLVAERMDKASTKFYWENRRFEAGSNRLERRLAVEELAGDGTVRKKRYRCVVLCLVEPERFRCEAAAAGFVSERVTGQGSFGETAALWPGGVGHADGARKAGGAFVTAATGTGRHLWLLTRPQPGGEGRAGRCAGQAR